MTDSEQMFTNSLPFQLEVVEPLPGLVAESRLDHLVPQFPRLLHVLAELRLNQRETRPFCDKSSSQGYRKPVRSGLPILIPEGKSEQWVL